MKLLSFIRDINSNPIRSRTDVIKVILQAIDYLIDKQYLVYHNFEGIDNNRPFLCIDKMSRLFIPEKEKTDGEILKIYSIAFPFSYNSEHHILSFNQININNLLNSCMKSVIDVCYGVLPETMEKILDYCWDTCSEYELPSPQSENLVALFTELLTFDIGYVRYDYDEKHQNGVLHPLYHLDINYSNQSTYKIGLIQPIDTLKLESILDTKRECWFLKEN